MTAQRPVEHDWKRASASASPPSVGTEDSLSPDDRAGVGVGIIAAHQTVAVERAGTFTEGAFHGFDGAKETCKSIGILYKDNMFEFLHSRNVDDLDELSNEVNDLIRAGKWEKAEKLCQKLRETFPEEIDGDDRSAQLYQARKEFAKALAYAQAALSKARGNPEKFDPELIADLEEQVTFLKEEAGS